MSGIDADARQHLSIAMRRAALCGHSSWGRTKRQGREEFPLVSILPASKRPSFLPWALANVARQTSPGVDLILAMHGVGFAEVEWRVAELPHPAKVLRSPASEPLGAVLDAAAEASTGMLLTKMDDDVYGADHLWDLVLAREYSGAQLVGKWLEFVYLAASDRTLRWFNGGGERYQTSALAGGTLLIARDGLDRCGGWQKVPGGVDAALTEDVRRARLPHLRRWVHDDSARLPPYLGRQGWFGRRPSRQSRSRLARVPAWPASRLRACRASGTGPGRNAVFSVKEALPSSACSTCLRVPDWYSRGLFEACRAARWAVGLPGRPSPRVLGRMNENSPTGRSHPRRVVRRARRCAKSSWLTESG